MHLVDGDILLYQFDGCSHSFLLALVEQAPFVGRKSMLTVHCRVILRDSGINEAAMVRSITMCCLSICVDSCVEAVGDYVQY